MNSMITSSVASTNLVTTLVTCFTSIITGCLARAKEQIVDPEGLSHHSLPPHGRSYENWTDWEAWEASAEISKAFPYYRSGYDDDGSVVYIVEFGKWNYRQLALMSEERKGEFWMYFEQFGRCLRRDATTCDNDNQGVVLVGDYDGFGLKHYASSAALQSALKMFVFVLKLNRFTKYGFAINMDFSAETFINIVKPLSENYLEKLEFYGTRSEKWKPKLLRKIPGSQLPPKYGGDKAWKPLPLHGPSMKACEN